MLCESEPLRQLRGDRLLLLLLLLYFLDGDVAAELCCLCVRCVGLVVQDFCCCCCCCFCCGCCCCVSFCASGAPLAHAPADFFVVCVVVLVVNGSQPLQSITGSDPSASVALGVVAVVVCCCCCC